VAGAAPIHRERLDIRTHRILLYLDYKSVRHGSRKNRRRRPQILCLLPFPCKENSAMRLIHDGSTSPTLLNRVAHWDDHPAWARFRATYDPRLRHCCRAYGLDVDAIDEVCQRIWIELAGRMRTFEYDPGGSFRGWLRRLCQSRVLNFLRERRAHPLFSLDDRDGEPADDGRETVGESEHIDEGEGGDDRGGENPRDAARRLLLGEGERVQAAVRARVRPHNWEAFWLVAVCDWSVERTAQALGMTKAAVYAARERIAAMLRDEGRRVLERRAVGD
jgi:RNA polymerase sigma factor (sigma-70 family)